MAQIAENQVDLPVAVAANQNAGTDTAVQGLKAVSALLGLTVTSKASPVQTLAVENINGAGAAAAAVSASSSTATAKAKATKSAKASSSASATGEGAAKKAGKNNNKRAMLKWANRMVEESI
jgi:hypothetical protein